MWWKFALRSGFLRPMNLSPLWIVACTAAGGPEAGAERGVCGPEVVCAAGLECWSERCIRPPPADCRAVGARLASRELGNYATPEEREPMVATWAKACEGERLSKAEGECITGAADDDAIAACPRPLVAELVGDPKGCEKIGKKAKQLVEQGVGGQLGPIMNVVDEVPGALSELCVEGRWSKAAKECLLSVTSFEDGERCVELLDYGQQKAVERRLRSLVMAGRRAPPRDPDDPWR